MLFGNLLLNEHHLGLDGGVDVEGGDLTDNIVGGEQVDNTLVDSHLEAVPGVGSVTARGLASGDVENLGGDTDGALDTDVLVLGSTNNISADCGDLDDIRDHGTRSFTFETINHSERQVTVSEAQVGRRKGKKNRRESRRCEREGR